MPNENKTKDNEILSYYLDVLELHFDKLHDDPSMHRKQFKTEITEARNYIMNREDLAVFVATSNEELNDLLVKEKAKTMTLQEQLMEMKSLLRQLEKILASLEELKK